MSASDPTDHIYAEVSDIPTTKDVGLAKDEEANILKKCTIAISVAIVVFALGVLAAIALPLSQIVSMQPTVSTMTERLDVLTQQMNASGALYQQFAQNTSALSVKVQELLDELLRRRNNPPEPLTGFNGQSLIALDETDTASGMDPPTELFTDPSDPPDPQRAGAVYTRWGKSSCPQTEGSNLLYSGLTGGTLNDFQGGGANHLCMPILVEYSLNLTYKHGAQGTLKLLVQNMKTLHKE